MNKMDELIEQIRSAALNVEQKVLSGDALTADEKTELLVNVKTDLANLRDQLHEIGHKLEGIAAVRNLLREARGQ
jgi:hypothetical protein